MPYAEHLREVSRWTDQALTASADSGRPFEGVVLHAGSEIIYHADDQPAPFRTVPHFARFVPVPGPGHLLVYRSGHRPTLYHVVARDYWHEAPATSGALVGHSWAGEVDVVEVASPLDAVRGAGDVTGFAYLGNDPGTAAALEIPAAAVEPAALLAALDWFRAFKTAYEVQCLEAAAERAAAGHAAVRAGALQRRSERELHALYLAACGQLEHDTPYGNIIGWDDKAAILHYQSKRTTPPDPGRVLLIDAGATALGYHSDVTRTYAAPDAHPAFLTLLDNMATLQRGLVDVLRPGLPYPELHACAARGITELLCDVGVLRVSTDEAWARRLAAPFFPHGLGHHLGLQVHDVGGKQASVAGGTVPAPADAPHLRTTRTLDAGHVVTIEPGLYFIPMLLDPLRAGADSAAFDWPLIDQLIPCGGIRIEDDVLVTERGPRDLTRPHIPGAHRLEG